MLNGVLDLARIEAGRLPLEEQDVALEEMLDAAIRPVRKTAADKSVAIMCGMMIQNEVRLDPTKMNSGVREPAVERDQFTPEGGSIEVDSELHAGWRRSSILVRDTGMGIPPEIWSGAGAVRPGRGPPDPAERRASASGCRSRGR